MTTKDDDERMNDVTHTPITDDELRFMHAMEWARRQTGWDFDRWEATFASLALRFVDDYLLTERDFADLLKEAAR